MDNLFKGIGKVVVIFFLAIPILGLAGFLFAIPIMFLWNWLMPAIFNLTTITYWQAIGVYWLSALLFRFNFNLTNDKN